MLSRDDIQGLLDRMAAAYSVGDAAACANMFTDNAQLHSPFAPPAIGRAALLSLHEDWTSEGGDKRFSILDFGCTHGLAWCLCRFSEGDVAGDGTSLIVLERGADDVWLIRSCCLHGDAELT